MACDIVSSIDPAAYATASHGELCEDCAMSVARLAVSSLLCIAACAAAAPPSQPVVVQGLDCRGEESGGWRLEANRTSAQLTTQSPRKREIVFRGSMQLLGFTTPPTVVWRGDSTHLPRETLVLTAREDACGPNPAAAGSPGYRAVVSIRPNEAASGCCAVRAGYDARVAPVANPAAKPADDWSRAIIDLLPAINACVARDAAKLKAVAGSSDAAQGPVRIQLVETGGATVDCTIDASGRGTPTLTAASATTVTGPLFYPPREPPPLVACGRLERVQTPRGALAGYLHYDPC